MSSTGLRALVLTAGVGDSHGAMARSLADDLRARPEVARVCVREDLAVLGPALGRFLTRGFRVHLGRVQWTYDLAYRLFGRTTIGRRSGAAALFALGGRALARTVGGEAPGVVVCTYPVLTPVLGMLRATGRIACPVLAVVEPLGGLAYWVHSGIDLHALLYAEALDEARRLGGEIRARPARPLVSPRFLRPPGRDASRAALGVPEDAALAVVSGGGWGVGDLQGAVRACLEVPRTQVIAVAGRNEALRDRLAQVFGDEPRVSVLGFTERMPELLAAADAFVTATAGLSCVEARLCGAPTICYGFQVGHVRDNTRALADRGLARIAHDPAALTRELASTVALPRPSAPEFKALPTVAELTVALARGELAPAPV